jgi:hypothetical protein
MKKDLSHLDKYREPHPITSHVLLGDTRGCFKIPHYNYKERDRNRTHFVVISSDGEDVGWDHVSAHVRFVDAVPRMRTPTWDEMCWIKDQFFNDDETVVQFHPKRSEHVNVHQHVLHLWKKVGAEHELPPGICV